MQTGHVVKPMEMKALRRGTLALLLWLPLSAGAQVEVRELSENEDQVAQWNRFVDDLYQLHQRLVASHDTYEKHRVGGYHRYPEFYDEVTTVDRETGRALSVIQWERRLPVGVVDRLASWLGMGQEWEGTGPALHSIAVNIYNEAGQLLRDYSATYLPGYRNAPMQTLVFLHDYRDGLHAFRSFDASGNRIYEACRGSHEGREVDIDLDEDRSDIETDDPSSITHSDLYRFCFERIPVNADEYLSPR
jgi:hypothetical protein